MRFYCNYYFRRAKCFLLNRRLKLLTRELHALSMQRAMDLHQENLLVQEIHNTQEELGEFLPLTFNFFTNETGRSDG
jgi:hypothetical protein